jgi:hypothetical protein
LFVQRERLVDTFTKKLRDEQRHDCRGSSKRDTTGKMELVSKGEFGDSPENISAGWSRIC